MKKTLSILSSVCLALDAYGATRIEQSANGAIVETDRCRVTIADGFVSEITNKLTGESYLKGVESMEKSCLIFLPDWEPKPAMPPMSGRPKLSSGRGQNFRWTSNCPTSISRLTAANSNSTKLEKIAPLSPTKGSRMEKRNFPKRTH